VTIQIGILGYPSCAPVRRREQFKALARKAGLIDYWRMAAPISAAPSAPTISFAIEYAASVTQSGLCRLLAMDSRPSRSQEHGSFD
jgi:hypothetical protein